MRNLRNYLTDSLFQWRIRTAWSLAFISGVGKKNRVIRCEVIVGSRGGSPQMMDYSFFLKTRLYPNQKCLSGRHCLIWSFWELHTTGNDHQVWDFWNFHSEIFLMRTSNYILNTIPENWLDLISKKSYGKWKYEWYLSFHNEIGTECDHIPPEIIWFQNWFFGVRNWWPMLQNQLDEGGRLVGWKKYFRFRSETGHFATECFFSSIPSNL